MAKLTLPTAPHPENLLGTLLVTCKDWTYTGGCRSPLVPPICHYLEGKYRKWIHNLKILSSVVMFKMVADSLFSIIATVVASILEGSANIGDASRGLVKHNILHWVALYDSPQQIKISALSFRFCPFPKLRLIWHKLMWQYLILYSLSNAEKNYHCTSPAEQSRCWAWAPIGAAAGAKVQAKVTVFVIVKMCSFK